MKYLIKTVESYRLNNEQEVEDFLKELKSDPTFQVAKYSSTKKEIKVKGEIVEEYIRLDVTKIFDDEKEPTRNLTIVYNEAKEY